MLGCDLAAACTESGIGVAGYDLPGLDIRGDIDGIGTSARCDWIVNCAAYTDVDGAESNRETAFAVNCDGARRVAELSAARGVPLLHLSTDYVFDGASAEPYREDDPVCPINVYGESKLAGEQAVRAATPDHVIVRTQSLYGVHGRNFVRTVRERLEDGQALEVVDDQTSCPTHTMALARAIVALLRLQHRGMVNVSAEGACTWHQFACEIAARVRPGAEVKPVASADFPRPARRPAYSVLDKHRYAEWTGKRMPMWQEGLDAYLGREAA